MTLITVGIDTELLLRQLRQRMRYLDIRIATLRPRKESVNPVTGFTATGALVELENERDWLTRLIQSVQGVEHET